MTFLSIPDLSLLSDSDLIHLVQSDLPHSAEAKLILLKRYKNLLLKTLRPYLLYFHDFEALLLSATVGFLLSVEKFNIQKGNSLGIFAKPFMLNLLSDCVKHVIDSDKNELNKDDRENAYITEVLESEPDNINLDEEVDKTFLKTAVEKFKSTLTNREKELIELVFFQNKKFIEAANEMGVSKQRASQIWNSIKEKGIHKLKYFSNIN